MMMIVKCKKYHRVLSVMNHCCMMNHQCMYDCMMNLYGEYDCDIFDDVWCITLSTSIYVYDVSLNDVWWMMWLSVSLTGDWVVMWPVSGLSIHPSVRPPAQQSSVTHLRCVNALTGL